MKQSIKIFKSETIQTDWWRDTHGTTEIYYGNFIIKYYILGICVWNKIYRNCTYDMYETLTGKTRYGITAKRTN